MTHRRNTSHTSPRAIHCAVVEAPAMSDTSGHRPATGFRELLPWADPYIASLIDKLRRSAGCEWPPIRIGIGSVGTGQILMLSMS